MESRLAGQHGSAEAYLAPEDWARLRAGSLVIEQLTPAAGAELPGALLHDWRGTAFVPGAKGADFERVMRDFRGYPRYFSPQVLKATVPAQEGDRYRATLRVRQTHILTVVMDTTYDVTFGRDNFEGTAPSTDTAFRAARRLWRSTRRARRKSAR